MVIKNRIRAAYRPRQAGTHPQTGSDVKHTPCLRDFLTDEQGSVFIFVGFLLVALIAIIGLTLDLGTQSIIKTRMQNASDAAALAGAISPTASPAEREATARRYFALNYPDNYHQTDLTAQNVGVTATDKTVEVDTGTRNRKTDILPVIGINTVQSRGLTQVGITNTPPATDIVLGLDVSGSMGTVDCGAPPKRCGFLHTSPASRIALLRASVDQFITQLAQGQDPIQNYSVAAVLYSGVIESSYNFNANTSGLQKYFSLQLKPHYRAGTVGGTAAKQVNTMFSRATRQSRFAVLMTDGQNTDPFSDRPSPIEDVLMLQECETMKKNGIIVYTISFGSDILYTPSIATLMKNCATGDTPEQKANYALTAVTGNELNSAFDAILQGIRQVRITR